MLDFEQTTVEEYQEFGRWLWKRADHFTTHEQISQFTTEALFNEFVLNGDPQVALVRVFRTVYAAHYPPSLRAIVGADEQSALILTGSYGIENTWCSRHYSRNHQAIPFSRIATTSDFPMFTEVMGRMGVDLQSLREGQRLDMQNYMGTYYINDAPRCTAFPSQDTFIRPYGIRSALGFGGFMYDLGHESTLYILSVFARVPITPDAAERFFSMQSFIGTALASRDTHTGVFDD